MKAKKGLKVFNVDQLARLCGLQYFLKIVIMLKVNKIYMSITYGMH
jgi:hypothetical protein